MGNRGSSSRKSQGEKKSVIYVRRMVEEVFPVEIDLNAPVMKLKEEIQKQKRIEVEDQLVDFAGVSLQDDQLLSAFGIQDSSHLHVMKRTRSHGWITIFVKTSNETFPLNLCAQSRLHNLQQKLFDLQGVDVKQQRIMFDGELQTEPWVKLETFGHGSTVELHLPRINTVTVCNAIDGKTYQISVDDFDTVRSVKMTIFHLMHIIPSAQRILIGSILVEDDVLMREYELTDASILDLHENKDAGKAIEVTVKLPSEKEIKVMTDRLKGVYSLKKHIEETERISIETQHLYLEERQLVEWKSLDESSVTDGSEIKLFTSTNTEIFVKDLTGKTHTFRFNLHDSVSAVKNKLGLELEIPPEEQRLIFAGRDLEDGRTLISYRLGADSSIQMALRLRGC